MWVAYKRFISWKKYIKYLTYRTLGEQFISVDIKKRNGVVLCINQGVPTPWAVTHYQDLSPLKLGWGSGGRAGACIPTSSLMRAVGKCGHMHSICARAMTVPVAYANGAACESTLIRHSHATILSPSPQSRSQSWKGCKTFN